MAHQSNLAVVRSELGNLHFAVKTGLEDIEGIESVTFGYDGYPGLGLFVLIKVESRSSRMVADRMGHGILHGPYDYRFWVQHQISNIPNQIVEIKAWPQI